MSENFDYALISKNKIKEHNINVFVTKNCKLRARVKISPGKFFEVTVGGKSWSQGKGKDFINIICSKINTLLYNLLLNYWLYLGSPDGGVTILHRKRKLKFNFSKD